METALRERIYAFMKEQGMRRTQQRDAIITAAFSTKEHYTAEQLLDMSRQLDATVSRATVYRTIPLLVDCGVLKEMDFGKDHRIYDPNYNEHPHHNHLICVDCEKIVEFEDRNIETLEDCITKRLGFSPEKKFVRIEAKCDQLQRSGVCENKGACGANRQEPAAK